MLCTELAVPQAEKLVKTLLMQPVAVCMGQHARLGQSSQLMKLDHAVLQMIVVYAFYSSENGDGRGKR